MLNNIWDYLYNVYLGVGTNYENLGFEKNPLFSLRLMVLGLFIGIVIACIAAAYHKQVLGGIARKLIAEGCLSAETAKSAKELGYGKNFLAKHALCRSVSLRRVVKCVEENEFYERQNAEEAEYEQRREAEPKLPKYKAKEYLIDIENDRFFIPEELRIRAEVKFEKKGSGWLSSVWGIVILCVAFLIILLALPHIFDAIDGFVGIFK